MHHYLSLIMLQWHVEVKFSDPRFTVTQPASPTASMNLCYAFLSTFIESIDLTEHLLQGKHFLCHALVSAVHLKITPPRIKNRNVWTNCI